MGVEREKFGSTVSEVTKKMHKDRTHSFGQHRKYVEDESATGVERKGVGSSRDVQGGRGLAGGTRKRERKQFL